MMMQITILKIMNVFFIHARLAIKYAEILWSTAATYDARVPYYRGINLKQNPMRWHVDEAVLSLAGCYLKVLTHQERFIRCTFS